MHMRVVVHLDSRDRREGSSPASYRLALPQIFKRVQRYRVLSAELSGTLDQIAGANAELFVSVDSGPATRVAVPDGVYALATMQGALTTALAAAFPDLTWRVDISPVTRRIAISTAEGAIVTVEGGGLASLLGFESGASGATVAGGRPVLLAPYAYVLIESDQLRGCFTGTTGPSTCLAKISLQASADHQPSPWMECLPPLASLESLHIRTRVYDAQVSTMPEHSLSLELELASGPPPPAPSTLKPPVPPSAAPPAAPLAPPSRSVKQAPLTAGTAAPLEARPQVYGTVLKQAGCAAAALAAVWTAFM